MTLKLGKGLIHIGIERKLQNHLINKTHILKFICRYGRKETTSNAASSDNSRSMEAKLKHNIQKDQIEMIDNPGNRLKAI